MYRQSFAAMFVAVAFFMFAPVAAANDFEKKVIIDGLQSPTGINLDLYGYLYFTEVPDPGVAEAGNKVSRYRLRTGKTKLISEGEPYPTNLASDLRGNVFWTCQTAGVILRASNFGTSARSVYISGLDSPVGIDVPLFRRNVTLFTQIPTPGTSGGDGGTNEVNISFNFHGSQFVSSLSIGEPEPADVAVSNRGDVYWTCTTAGVILKRDRDGEVSVVIDGLDSPVGLDIDFFGRLYWTEVPTPGVSGDDGGTNRVVRYNPENGHLRVISEGEPEPADVTVSYFGDRIYWTCKTAGVIIRAKK